MDLFLQSMMVNEKGVQELANLTTMKRQAKIVLYAAVYVRLASNG